MGAADAVCEEGAKQRFGHGDGDGVLHDKHTGRVKGGGQAAGWAGPVHAYLNPFPVPAGMTAGPFKNHITTHQPTEERSMTDTTTPASIISWHPSKLFPDTTDRMVYMRQITRLGQLEEATKTEVYAWLKRTPQVVLRLIDGIGWVHQGSYAANLNCLKGVATRFAEVFGDGTVLNRWDAMSLAQAESEVAA